MSFMKRSARFCSRCKFNRASYGGQTTALLCPRPSFCAFLHVNACLLHTHVVLTWPDRRHSRLEADRAQCVTKNKSFESFERLGSSGQALFCIGVLALRETFTTWEIGNIADAWKRLDGEPDLKDAPQCHVCTPNQSGKFMKLTHSDRPGPFNQEVAVF